MSRNANNLQRHIEDCLDEYGLHPAQDDSIWDSWDDWECYE